MQIKKVFALFRTVTSEVNWRQRSNIVGTFPSQMATASNLRFPKSNNVSVLTLLILYNHRLPKSNNVSVLTLLILYNHRLPKSNNVSVLTLLI